MAVDFLFVVDKKNSPLWLAAASRSKNFNCTILAATDFVSAYSLAKHVISFKPRVVIISWRIAFDQLVSRKRSKQVLLKSNLSIYLLVADFVGIHKLSETEQCLITSADGFLVTSNLLRKAYLDNYQINSIDLLHDLPDLDQHSRIRNTKTSNVSKKIIWVGNSKWGNRLGFKDHKGLNKLAIPVFNILKTLDKNIEIRIIDSADSRIENSRVLEEIQEAACLLVTSDSEGTALPILEAAALGTPVVSVDVGIASEILTGELSDQIVNRDPEYIAGRIIETIKKRESISPLIQKNWEIYKSIAEIELENLMYNVGAVGLWRRSKPKNQIVPYIVWLLRHIRS